MSARKGDKTRSDRSKRAPSNGSEAGADAKAPPAAPARPTARKALAIVLLIGFCLRVVYVLQSRANPYFDEPQMDALYHVEWARAWALGNDFQPGPFFRAPLYPWFLGLCFKLFGEGYLLPRLVQAGIGTVSLALVYWVGTLAFDRRVGLGAAILAAQYWVLIYFDGELLLPTLEVPLNLLAIGLALRCAERAELSRAALAGAALGLSALVRPNVLLFAPFVAIWLGVFPKVALRQRARAALMFVAGAALLILPITAYNAFVGKDRVLISSQGGVNFWIGNNPESDGSTAIVPGTRPDWWGGYEDSIHLAEAAEGRTLKPSEVSQHYTRKALEFMRSNPGAALRHMLWKLRLFWIDFELGNNQDERFFAYRFGPVLRWLPIGFGVLAPLGLFGWILCARSMVSRFPLWAFLPVYTVSVVAFFVCSRFRVPVLPVLMVFAAYTCTWAWDAWRARRYAPLAALLAGAASIALCVEAVPRQVDRTDASGLWQLGVHAALHDEPERAIELYRSAIAANPRLVRAHQDLGFALQAAGDHASAEQSFRRALALDPANVSAAGGLFELLIADARYDDARRVAESSTARAPHFARGPYNRGRAAFLEAESLSRRTPRDDARIRALLEEALPWFREARAMTADRDTHFDAALAEASVHYQLNQPAEALEAAEHALSLRQVPDAPGWFWQCQRLRLRALLDLERAAEARSVMSDLRTRFSADPRAGALAAELGI